MWGWQIKHHSGSTPEPRPPQSPLALAPAGWDPTLAPWSPVLPTARPQPPPVCSSSVSASFLCSVISQHPDRAPACLHDLSVHNGRGLFIYRGPPGFGVHFQARSQGPEPGSLEMSQQTMMATNSGTVCIVQAHKGSHSSGYPDFLVVFYVLISGLPRKAGWRKVYCLQKNISLNFVINQSKQYRKELEGKSMNCHLHACIGQKVLPTHAWIHKDQCHLHIYL